MHTTERLFLYGGLIGLAAVVAFQNTAHTSAPVPGDLGPADALVLTGKDSNLTIRNGNGRLQWGDQPTAKAWSIAGVNADKVMRALMKSPRNVQERQTMDDESQKKREDFDARYRAFREKYANVDPRAPGSEDMQREFELFREEVDQWREEFSRRYARMEADQIERAFREMTTAVDLVAERLKIDLVFRFVPTNDKFDLALDDEEKDDQTPLTPMHAMGQIGARTFLRHPEALDITPEVIKELGLKE